METKESPAEWRTYLDVRDLREQFGAYVRASFGEWIDASQPHYSAQLQFATGRLEEGIALAEHFDKAHPETAGKSRVLRVLDVGAGNGGTSLGMANCTRYEVTALDMVVNRGLRWLRRQLGLPIHQIAGDGTCLPVSDGTFDVVLLLETIEHVTQPHRMGAEIMRVLKPGGVCMITTPPRLHYLFRPDPHFGVRGLLLLSDRLQRWYVTRIAHRFFRSHAGTDSTYYDVHHIYSSLSEIAALFPEPKRVGAYYLPAYQGPGLWRRFFRPYSWDRILIYKL